MSLGDRSARRHETVRTQAVRSEDYWDFSPGERVSTVDGFLGRVVAVEDGPVAGYESYEVELDNGLGGGLYTSGQLRATTDRTAKETTGKNTAAESYPELAEVLQDRVDPGKYPSAGLMMGLASKTAQKVQAEVGGKPGLCPNNHLTWGGECASCRNTDTDQNAIVVNKGDHHPQNVEHTRNAKSAANVHGFGWSSLCEEDPEDEGYCAYHGAYHNNPYPFRSGTYCDTCGQEGHEDSDHEDDQPQPYCDRCGHEGHDEDDHEQTCGQCGNSMKGDGRHPYNGVGLNEECPNSSNGFHQRVEERFQKLDPDKYCNEGCRGSHATDMEIGLDDELHERSQKADQQHVCRNCGSPLMGSVGDQMSGIADPRALHMLKTNPTGPTKYSALEYGWRMLTAARTDEDLAFHVTASWTDVRNKAKRIRSDGGVHITASQNGYVVAQVQGDHGTYESVLMRYPGTQKIGQWDCGCKWATYHWGAPDDFSRFAGRMCSHALALNFEAQSRGMFGREIKPNEGVPRWLNKHLVERVSSRQAEEFSTEHEHDPHSFLQTFAALAVKAGESPATVAGLLSVLSAVNSPFGEPGPHPVPGISPSGPTERRRQENPASAGFLTSSDPDGWDDQNPQDLGDRMAIKKGDPEWDEAGLGCPHCDDGFFSMKDRSDHIRDEHPGEYQGPSQNMADLFEMRPELKHLGSQVEKHALTDMEGTAMSETGLCGSHYKNPELREMALANAREGLLHLPKNEKWDGDEQFKDCSGNDDLGCLACDGANPMLERLHSEVFGHEGSLDEAIFEPEMTKEGFLPLLLEALPALAEAAGAAGAGEAAGAAGAGAAAGEAGAAGEAAGGGGGLTKAIKPMMNVMPKPGGAKPAEQAHQQVQQDKAGGEVAQGNNAAGFEHAYADPWGKNGVLEPEPEAALPETFGADEDEATVGGVTAAATPTGVEYSVPTDQGQSGGSLAPGTDLKSDPTDLEPENPSFVSTGMAGSVADILAQFQRTAGAQAIGSGTATATKDTQDIASAAQAYLQKEAMAVFTPAQQQELIDEGKDVQAGNLDRLQIEGTHYEALEAALADDDDEDGWMA